MWGSFCDWCVFPATNLPPLVALVLCEPLISFRTTYPIAYRLIKFLSMLTDATLLLLLETNKSLL